MRLIFMGTPDFAVPALNALADRHEIVAVYTQPPRPAGRGKMPRASAVQRRAEALGLEVYHPTSLRSADVQAAFAAREADVAVVVAYGLILPPQVLSAPRLGCLNIHASLLPRWRGAAPIQRAIMAGDRTTGVCIMQMDAGLDTGPVLSRNELLITRQDRASTLETQLSHMGAEAIVAALENGGAWQPEPQPETGICYAAKIDKTEARVDFSRPASEVDRLIRGLSPFPGAWIMVGDERIKLLHSQLGESAEADAAAPHRPGQVLHGFTIACGDGGAVEVLEAQRQGRKPMSARDVLHGIGLPGVLE